MVNVIALDIDGTAACDCQAIPPAVAEKLESLTHEGWVIALITGRTFRWSTDAIKNLSFSYYLAVQNGASLLQMPDQTVVSRKYLTKEIFPVLDEICADKPSDYIVFGGVELDDRCFYRPERFSTSLRQYLESRQVVFGEQLVPVSSFDDIEDNGFGSVKCFGSLSEMTLIQNEIIEKLDLCAPLIRDPYDEKFYILQATHPQVNKGSALQNLCDLVQCDGIVIAAGDDNNDLTMLEVADIAIAMERAPDDLKQKAQIIAPPAEQMGILTALDEAIALQRENDEGI